MPNPETVSYVQLKYWKMVESALIQAVREYEDRGLDHHVRTIAQAARVEVTIDGPNYVKAIGLDMVRGYPELIGPSGSISKIIGSVDSSTWLVAK